MNAKKGLSILAIAIVGGLVALGFNKLFTNESAPQSFQDHQNAKFTLAEKLADVPQLDFVSVAEVSTPAVVHIKSTISAKVGTQQQHNPFEDFFNGPMFPQQRGPQIATGSGVIIKKDGYIVTNNHVVDGATKVEVVLDDNRP